MSKVILCDVCKKVRKKVYRMIVFGIGETTARNHFDICTVCFNKVNKILNLKKREK